MRGPTAPGADTHACTQAVRYFCSLLSVQCMKLVDELESLGRKKFDSFRTLFLKYIGPILSPRQNLLIKYYVMTGKAFRSSSEAPDLAINSRNQM